MEDFNLDLKFGKFGYNFHKLELKFAKFEKLVSRSASRTYRSLSPNCSPIFRTSANEHLSPKRRRLVAAETQHPVASGAWVSAARRRKLLCAAQGTWKVPLPIGCLVTRCTQPATNNQ